MFVSSNKWSFRITVPSLPHSRQPTLMTLISKAMKQINGRYLLQSGISRDRNLLLAEVRDCTISGPRAVRLLDRCLLSFLSALILACFAPVFIVRNMEHFLLIS